MLGFKSQLYHVPAVCFLHAVTCKLRSIIVPPLWAVVNTDQVDLLKAPRTQLDVS